MSCWARTGGTFSTPGSTGIKSTGCAGGLSVARCGTTRCASSRATAGRGSCGGIPSTFETKVAWWRSTASGSTSRNTGRPRRPFSFTRRGIAICSTASAIRSTFTNGVAGLSRRTTRPALGLAWTGRRSCRCTFGTSSPRSTRAASSVGSRRSIVTALYRSSHRFGRSTGPPCPSRSSPTRPFTRAGDACSVSPGTSPSGRRPRSASSTC